MLRYLYRNYTAVFNSSLRNKYFCDSVCTWGVSEWMHSSTRLHEEVHHYICDRPQSVSDESEVNVSVPVYSVRWCTLYIPVCVFLQLRKRYTADVFIVTTTRLGIL